jgi:hypothetical protein
VLLTISTLTWRAPLMSLAQFSLGVLAAARTCCRSAAIGQRGTLAQAGESSRIQHVGASGW